MKKIKIELLKKPTEPDLRDINMLIPLTMAKPHLLSMGELRRMLRQERFSMAVARISVGGKMSIVGMASATFSYIPTGSVSVIEDVIVDDAFRGMGLGKKIIQKLIEAAKKNHAKHIGLRADPGAEIANKMYRGLGFWKANVVYYRINILLPALSRTGSINKIAALRSDRAKLYRDESR